MEFTYTQQEMDDITKNFFSEEGRLKALPVKAKRKYIALCALRNLLPDGEYTEKGFGELLDTLSDIDRATMRRELVDAGFVERRPDGSMYRVESHH